MRMQSERSENGQIIEEDEEEMVSLPDDMQAIEQEVNEIDEETVLQEILTAARKDFHNYDNWQSIAKTIKENPPFSHEENVARTRVLQAQKEECERILEEEIVPFLGGKDQALKKIKAAIAEQEEIRVEEVRFYIQNEHKLSRPLGDALYRFTNRDKVLRALQNKASGFVSDTTKAQEFHEALSQLNRIDDKRKESINEIVNHNLGLVVSFANRYAPYAGTPRAVSMSLWDVFQEGVIGCMRGADTYDPQTGYKFSTYAGSCIKQAMQRAISTKEAAIRLPGEPREVLANAAKAYRALLQETGREPTLFEVADRIGVTADELDQINSVRAIDSLDEPAAMPGDTRSLQIADPTADTEVFAIENVSREELFRAINTLPDNLRNVILAVHFSSQNGEMLSFREVGARAREFGVVSNKSRERAGEGAVSHQAVHQLYNKALRMLRKKLKST